MSIKQSEKNDICVASSDSEIFPIIIPQNAVPLFTVSDLTVRTCLI